MKISLAVRYPFGACSYYRTMGVFPKLKQLEKEIEIEQINGVDWSYLSNTDILYLERPQDNDFYAACKTAKDFNVKVWIDYDDDLFNIPSYNPCKKTYDDKTIRDSIKKCLEIADVVTVTTKDLKDLYSQYNDNIYIVENAFNDYNYSLPDKISNNKIINWRGSTTHRGDLIEYLEMFVKLSHKYHKKWGWSFIGSDIWYVTDYMKNVFQSDEMAIQKYFSYIKKYKPSIQISPLILNEFNSAKSNISWIEGVYSGACHVGPNLQEFNKPGIETYNNQKEFTEKLERLMRDGDKRSKNFDLSLQYIKDNLLLSDINEKRLKIAKEILK